MSCTSTMSARRLCFHPVLFGSLFAGRIFAKKSYGHISVKIYRLAAVRQERNRCLNCEILVMVQIIWMRYAIRNVLQLIEKILELRCQSTDGACASKKIRVAGVYCVNWLRTFCTRSSTSVATWMPNKGSWRPVVQKTRPLVPSFGQIWWEIWRLSRGCMLNIAS